MKEKFELNPRSADIVGHCKVEYKDPITDKVLEKIEGDNHVFIDQFYVKDLKSLLSCNLILTDGTDTLDTSLPMIPGKPVGYGKINSQATGIFQGAYRTTDSYIYKVDSEKIESNYVYDFLSSQIPDTIRYVGLAPTWSIDHTFLLRDGNINTIDEPKINCIDENCIYTLSINSARSTINNIFTYFDEVIINIDSQIAGQNHIEKNIYNLIISDIDVSNTNFEHDGQIYTNVTNTYVFSMAYDNNNKNFIIRCSNAKSGRIVNSTWGTLINIYYWTINKELNNIISKNTFSYWSADSMTSTLEPLDFSAWDTNSHYTTGLQSSSNTSSITTRYGFIDNNNNFCVFTYLGSAGARTNTLSIRKQNLETGTFQEINLPHFVNGSTYPILTRGILNIYKNYVWLNRYNYSHPDPLQDSNILVYPVFNINNNSVYCWATYLNSENRSTSNWTHYGGLTVIKKGFGMQFPNTFMLAHYGSDVSDNNVTSFALTAYRLPLDAPPRPEGAAITVTYNLQIFY